MTFSYGRAPSAARYVGDSVSTASPARLLVLLYERLELDLRRGEHAQRNSDREGAHKALVHAQDLVHELLATLDAAAWSGGPGLASLYTWLLSELAQANMTNDPDRVATARRDVVEPLTDAWRRAAASTVGEKPPALNGVA